MDMPDPPHKVLIADSETDASAAAAKLLESSQLIVERAPDAAEAMAVASRHDIDLILLDVHLPGGGVELLRKVRGLEVRRYLPAIVTACNPSKQERLSALELGADDFVAKPYDGDELIARIRRSLGMRRRVDALLIECAELQRISLTDGLTQLHNQRFFQERLREEFRRAQRYDDPLSLILADLDHFKDINDRYGHQVGDQVLYDVAQTLRKSTRETDLVARYGGEEFAIILPKTHLSGSLTVAERVMKDLAGLKAGPSGSIRVTTSLGLSGYPNRSVSTVEQLLSTADQALYRAKREGRNRICLHQQRSVHSDPEIKLA